MKRVPYNYKNLRRADPARIKRKAHNKAEYDLFYKICIGIPTTILLALVFFIIFFMSPRGESVRLYQKEIFEWNKMRMSEHMDSL